MFSSSFFNFQPFSRAFDASSPPAVAAGNAPYYFQPGATMPFFQGGVAYYPQPPAPPADASAAQQAAATVYQRKFYLFTIVWWCFNIVF